MRATTFWLVSSLIVALAVEAQAAPPDRIVRGDLFVGPGEHVGDVAALGGDVVVQGWVEGRAASLGGDVHVLPGARVDGDLRALGGAVVVEPGAMTSAGPLGPPGRVEPGPVAQSPGPVAAWTSALTSFAGERVWLAWPRRAQTDGGRIWQALSRLAVLLLFGALLLRIAPMRVRALAAAAAAFPGKSLGVGLVVILVTALAILLAAATGVGKPLAAVLAAALGLGALLGLCGLSILIGELVPVAALRERPYLKLLVGASVLVGVLAVPIAGPVIGAIATVIGLGSLALTRLRTGNAVFGGRSPFGTSA